VLHARFPGSIATHSALQDFFFGDDLLLRRIVARRPVLQRYSSRLGIQPPAEVQPNGNT
jgi:hypothetical protein